MEILNSYFNSDYNRGKIYKITFKKNDRCYIGSTCQEFKDRLRERITNNKSAVNSDMINLKLNQLLMHPVKTEMGGWSRLK